MQFSERKSWRNSRRRGSVFFTTIGQIKKNELYFNFFFFAACSKQNIFKQQWQIQEGRNTATINQAYFCFNSDYLAMDTIDEYFTVAPDDSYYLKGQIKVKNAIPYEDLFIRNYYIYLKQIE